MALPEQKHREKEQRRERGRRLAERKQREKEQRREHILRAAERLFFSRSYDDVSMDEIATEAELSKATLYLYFKDKESLFFAVVNRGIKILCSIIKEEKKHEADLVTALISGGYGRFLKVPRPCQSLLLFPVRKVRPLTQGHSERRRSRDPCAL